MLLKVCGLKQQSNIENIVVMKPDMIGLIFYEYSKRYVGSNATHLQAFIKDLPGVKKTGVFVNPGYQEVLLIATIYNLDFVQLHGDESVDLCARISKVAPVIKTFSIRDGFDFETLREYEEHCAFFLFDTYTKDFGGSGKKFDWTMLNNYKLDTKFFLSGGIGIEDVEAIKNISHSAFVGIDVNSRFEEEPGIKNIEKIKQLVYEIRN